MRRFTSWYLFLYRLTDQKFVHTTIQQLDMIKGSERGFIAVQLARQSRDRSNSQYSQSSYCYGRPSPQHRNYQYHNSRRYSTNRGSSGTYSQFGGSNFASGGSAPITELLQHQYAMDRILKMPLASIENLRNSPEKSGAGERGQGLRSVSMYKKENSPTKNP